LRENESTSEEVIVRNDLPFRVLLHVLVPVGVVKVNIALSVLLSITAAIFIAASSVAATATTIPTTR